MAEDYVPDDYRILWVIRLQNYEGDVVDGDKRQSGYVSENALLWEKLCVCDDKSGAVKYATRDAAEQALLRLEKQFGLDRAHANIESMFVQDTFELQLAGNQEDDGIAVVREKDGRFIVVRNCGFEASEAIPVEIADLLVAVLWKIQKRVTYAARDTKHPDET
jgi:hypothetical protein